MSKLTGYAKKLFHEKVGEFKQELKVRKKIKKAEKKSYDVARLKEAQSFGKKKAKKEFKERLNPPHKKRGIEFGSGSAFGSGSPFGESPKKKKKSGSIFDI